MSVFTGKQGKGAKKVLKESKRSEAEERQHAFNALCEKRGIAPKNKHARKDLGTTEYIARLTNA